MLKTLIAVAMAATSLAASAKQLDVQTCYRIARNADYAARAGIAGAPLDQGKWGDGADNDPVVGAARRRALEFSWVHNAPGTVALQRVVPECRNSVDTIIRARRGW